MQITLKSQVTETKSAGSFILLYVNTEVLFVLSFIKYTYKRIAFLISFKEKYYKISYSTVN